MFNDGLFSFKERIVKIMKDKINTACPNTATCKLGDILEALKNKETVAELTKEQINILNCACPAFEKAQFGTQLNNAIKGETVDTNAPKEIKCPAGIEKYLLEEDTPIHNHNYSPRGSVDNGDGTHTTSYSCTNTTGECNVRTYTETNPHSYTSYPDGDIMVYRCECGNSYSEFID